MKKKKYGSPKDPLSLLCQPTLLTPRGCRRVAFVAAQCFKRPRVRARTMNTRTRTDGCTFMYYLNILIFSVVIIP